ncbi:MAG TPA: DNA polymerase III subunit gamma/tau [Ramlibacter sp.]|jgi:DNA polymerase-3 subunit gamma/tau|uniref:DNA polymerase III subunit gamma/tau n=1 Tax=Ramlibacter sp. TaxID=1917967 RepID=UPI002D300123|nr:DNA polymerase III subunit gamma/tau [Ramlibacter sp.]HZY18247.1 DNA polymerase III subunit gamma/tau [Ramlibacter sp.]
MSYLVLARKYRPKTFTEMVGQEHVVQALSNALTQQRLHHAYLFTGTRGVGKTTVSRVLAKSLNCQGPDGQGGITAAPCGVCQACTDIDGGRFVDYTELDAASNRGVDEVQSLLEQAVYKPVQGRFKVFMIDEVHMLTGHAFNAMLKTLEEPPEYLKFVLATTDPQKVPVTVLSRCLQFNLRPMAPETVQEHLAHVLQAESIEADPLALRLIARAARGSMRDALSLTDQAIAFGGGSLQEAAVRQMLGSVDRSHVFRLVDALAAGDGRTVVEVSEQLRLHGLSAGGALEEMAAVLQRMAVVQAVPGAADAADPDAAEIARLAGLLPMDETQLLYTMCLHGRAELGLAPDEYAALTMVLLRLLAFQAGPRADAPAEKKTLNAPARPAEPRPAASPSAPGPAATMPTVASSAGAPAGAAPPRGTAPSAQPLAQQPVRTVAPAAPAAPQRPAEAPAAARPQQAGVAGALPPGQVLPVVDPPAVRPASGAAGRERPSGDVLGVPVRVQPESAREAAASPAASFVPSEEGDFWHATVQQLVAAEAVTALVRELALQSQLVARDTGHWLLRVERESLNQPATRERLQNALRAAGHEVSLGVEIGAVNDSPARRNAAAAAQRQRAAEEVIHNDPFVQQMMRDFGARIVPGSIKPV